MASLPGLGASVPWKISHVPAMLLWLLLIIGILAMIIIPVNPHVIDYLIAINLTVSVSLLMVALYIPSAVHLSIFPSLLLITTLYRLGVNIASTRQILLHANAGHIIFSVR